MKEIHAEIEINATAEQVWQVLTDFASYPQWNPFIRQASGTLTQNSRLELLMQPTGSAATKIKPILLEVEPQHKLHWLGHILIPGIFDGEHFLTIESIGDQRVRFVQHEIFRGILVSLFSSTLKAAQQSFIEMNQALKSRVEQNN